MFHNLSGYDAHLFIRELGAHTSEMGVIMKNKEDYISFSIKVPVEKYIDKEGNEKDKLFLECFWNPLISMQKLVQKRTSRTQISL